MKTPRGWHEVSIEQFLKYTTICTRKWEDPIDLEINVLATFTSKDPKEIEKLKTKELMGYIKEMDFLKALPKSDLHAQFKCNGATYRPTLVFTDMTAGQFVNFTDILKGVNKEDYIYQMHNLLGAMCVKREWTLTPPFSKFEYKGYLANSDEFYKHLPVSIAYPYYVFFCKVMERTLLDTQSYLNKELKKMVRSNRRTRWGLLNIGGGILSTIRSAITTRLNGKR